MKLYLIGGLGADERVFQYLTIEPPTQVIKWISAPLGLPTTAPRRTMVF